MPVRIWSVSVPRARLGLDELVERTLLPRDCLPKRSSPDLVCIVLWSKSGMEQCGEAIVIDIATQQKTITVLGRTSGFAQPAGDDEVVVEIRTWWSIYRQVDTFICGEGLLAVSNFGRKKMTTVPRWQYCALAKSNRASKSVHEPQKGDCFHSW